MDNQEIIKQILDINGYEKLNPVQLEASNYIGDNVLISSPTASGKTTIFELNMLDCAVNKKKKVIYISPLKALTSEHYRETKNKFSKKYDLKVGISTGDLDNSSKYLSTYDVLFLTFEKFDSILRHEPDWLKDIGLITIDEVHELGSDRGATLEVLITQIKQSFPKINFLCLSATIGNSNELAQWLKAKLIKSDYRPVPLETGIFFDNQIYFENSNIKLENTSNIKDNGLGNIIIDTLNKNKQIIVFCNSRKNTMSFAKKYSNIVSKHIDEKTTLKLKNISKDIGGVLETPTKQCLALHNSISNGCCFHHAGLVYKQREIIEEEFKKGNIKVIFATPTLAAGINLPAYRVVINTIYRFSNGGLKPIPVNEFHQMTGRAGRPKYDTKGEALAIVNKEKDISLLYNSYVIAPPTDIESQLSKIGNLRVHLLSIIMVNRLDTMESILEYISKTFYYHVFGNNSQLRDNITDIINEFVYFEFLKKTDDDKLEITKLGKKVCLLYLDPISANNIIEDLKLKDKKEFSDTEKIFTITNTTELFPYAKYKKTNEEFLFDLFEDIKQNIYFSYEDLHLLSKIWQSQLLNDWINEVPEENIIEKYNTSPGQIQDMINKSIWINHCILELAKITGVDLRLYKKYKDLELRLKYGIKEELLQLVQLKNIGRVRARKLVSHNIKTVADIKKDPHKFISVIGKIGLEVLQELKVEFNKEKENADNKDKEKINKQKSIFDYK